MVSYPFQNPELPIDERVEDLISRLTLEEKIHLMCQYQDEIKRLGIRKYKHGTEGAHGVAWLGKATVFPQNIGLSCTWNEGLMKQIGDVIATEARIYYQKDPELNGLTIWAPTVDMVRDPRWGRTEEAYGEDPYLTGKLTTALIKGIQGDDQYYLKAAATLKHFFANNNEKDRGECSVTVTPRNMREYYYKAFEMQVREGKVQSIMTAYNAVNGVPCNVRGDVKNVVKKQWGMDGFVVSDAGDVVGTVREHRYVDSYAEAVALSIKNGVDSITDDKNIILPAIRQALEEGLLTEKDLDEALKNTFRVRFRLGEFDPPQRNPYSFIPESRLCCEEHSRLSLRAARESIVLLKNEGILPLKIDKIDKVAVIGSLANEVHTDWYSGTPPYKITPLQGIVERAGDKVIYADGLDRIRIRSVLTGKYIRLDEKTHLLYATGETADQGEVFIHADWGWGSHTLHSASNEKFVAVDNDNYLAAVSQEAKGWFVKEVFQINENGNYVQMKSWNGNDVFVQNDGALAVREQFPSSDDFEIDVVASGIDEAVKAAKQAEAAIVFVGNNPFINGKECIDRPDIQLPPAQELLIQKVFEANRNTIVVIVGSYPFAVNWADEHVPAILYTSHAGQELGRALSDVLFGEYNPAGRLSMTWYRSADQLPDIMDYDIIKGKRTYQYFDGDELYPFGHGLSYTTFQYRDFRIDRHCIELDESIRVTVTVENCGDYDGDEVVQLYVRANQSAVPRPLKTLKGFKRIHLKKGESKEVSFDLYAKDLAIWNVSEERYLVEEGTYTVMVGSSSKCIYAEADFTVKGEKIPPHVLCIDTKAVHFDDYQSVDIVYIKEKNGYCVRSNGPRSWITFHRVDMNKAGRTFLACLSVEVDEASIEVRIESPDGLLAGKYAASKTASFQVIEVPLLEKIEGLHDIYITFSGTVQLDWIRIC
ncbi:glycoside hydrolase family 3 C-terminal domain-containing protein [Geobacillus sp. PK12]|uniref:XynB4 n=1 Tax=Geobacillus thermodenitrificans TaxID=33940 RepID=A0A291I5S3_GEOTD|nr:glycoside hydrolase family 3 C-terminal domain-containing protein [Geobacillus sp. PK12]ATG84603.1 XynB4 [Geobacillus thermodenitrificans]RXS90480.1 carbohydrate-binding protein [Geobacillus sp. PK12]